MKRFLLFLLLPFLLIAGCRPRPVNPAPTTAPAPPAASATALPSPTPLPASPTATGTPRPLPAATPWPTPFPAPFLGESIMGIEITGLNFGSNAGAAAGAGAFWVRWNGILWSDVEPNPGDRNWEALSRFEEQLAALDSNGLQLIAIVRSTPAWAQAAPGEFCGPVAADALDAFGDFMFDLVARYSGAPYGVKYWELGNEPDVDPRFVDPDSHFGCWGDEDDPYYGAAAYAAMLNAVYPRIKAADPEAQVLVGGLLMDCDPVDPPLSASGAPRYCDPSLFLEGILVSGGGGSFDGVSFHAYDHYDASSGLFGNPNWHSGYTLSGLVPAVVAKARFIKSVLAAYGHAGKILFNTETSLLCGKTGDEAECSTPQHERMKSYYVAMTYAAALSEGVQGNIWYAFSNSWRRTGLTGPGGAEGDPLLAYRFASSRLSGAVYWGQVQEHPGVTGYKFLLDGVEWWIVWSLDGAAHEIVLGDAPEAAFDVLGAHIDPADKIEIGVAPVYLAWGP